MRGILRVLPIALLAALLPLGAARADLAPLTPSPTLVSAGDTITVTGAACPAGSAVSQVLQQTLGPNFAKGVAPFVPLDMNALSLSDTPQGISFEAVAATPRRTLYFQVKCSDGTGATSAPGVTVKAPPGEYWWTYNAYGAYVTSPGAELWFTASTWDCLPGATATATLTTAGGQLALGPLTTSVTPAGLMEFDITVPATFAPGTYTGTISCAGPQGRITNSTPVLVLADGAVIPGTGSQSAALSWLAGSLIGAGLMMRVTARRRMH